jgi:hypothetical protein
MSMIWSGITAPFVYPVWYILKKQFTNSIYKNTSWQEISSLLTNNKTTLAKYKLLANGIFNYWIWTYSDLIEPLGNGGLPESYGTSNFWKRFYYSAIRNPRFNINYMNFRTGTIVQVITVTDTRNFHIMHKSAGISDSPDGILFKWVKDNGGYWYIVYEDNNSDNIFYFEYIGFNIKDVGQSGGRFETSYRKTENTYTN